MLRRFHSLFFFISLAMLSCTVSKPVAKTKMIDTTACQFTAKMLDYTSNSNCQFLFQLEDGTKLLPATMPPVEIPFYAENKVMIGYQEIVYDKTKSNIDCGAEDKVVEITCMETYVEDANLDPKTHEECQKVTNLFISNWMPRVVEEIKPQKVFEYEYAVGYLYLFKKNDSSNLYDCLGNKLCDTNDGGDCSSLIGTLGEAKLIQVLKN